MKVKLGECLVSMEVDTVAVMSLMSEAKFGHLRPGRDLHPSEVRLQSYSKKPSPVRGGYKVNIDYQC